jgi:tetratricopeptide (TPR) repeat protein
MSSHHRDSRQRLVSDWEEVNALLARKLPGVRLDSVVQGWAYLDDFERGIRSYGGLASPSAEDDRWLGVCHFKLFDDMKALEMFARAGDRGALGARVNQAHLLRFLERSAESSRILDDVDPTRLSRYDQVLYFRVRSIHEETGGNIRSALSYAEEAWRKAQGTPEFDVLAPSVLAQLGVLYARYGRAQRALWHLERGIQMTTGTEQLKVRLKRAIVLTTLGRYFDARSELSSLSLLHEAASLNAERHFLLGDVAWSLGELERAIASYRVATENGQGNDFVYEVFLSHISIMTIAGYLGRVEDANRHREEARRRISDKSDELQFEFRSTLLDLWLGSLSKPCASMKLSGLSSRLFDMGLLQEMGSVNLHLAAISGSGSPMKAGQLLDELRVLSVTLQNSAFLAREWALLPQFRRHASKTHPSLAGLPPAVLELRTLGEERIVLAGSDVRLPLRRSAELLAYFLEHKAVTFEQVRTDLFPEEKARTAKSYFHQFRHQLREQVDGLEVEFDGESRMYRLKSEIDILWDVADLRAGRRKEAAGPFLPTSSSDWALTLDHALERYRVRR